MKTITLDELAQVSGLSKYEVRKRAEQMLSDTTFPLDYNRATIVVSGLAGFRYYKVQQFFGVV